MSTSVLKFKEDARAKKALELLESQKSRKKLVNGALTEIKFPDSREFLVIQCSESAFQCRSIPGCLNCSGGGVWFQDPLMLLRKPFSSLSAAGTLSSFKIYAIIPDPKRIYPSGPIGHSQACDKGENYYWRIALSSNAMVRLDSQATSDFTISAGITTIL
ncbi:hypothetical protein MG293_015047 [Ovis ammon polii]|uniref:Uncharacterized protein n=1 Tax=Ovis ammon polii TaxID=230172 RepID=A0AAD4TWZ1_OVIAM|nr:hypothetical protein MG293_015047 [Ovis ammon polii]